MVLLLFAAPWLAAAADNAEPPESWIDPDTGHRIVRLMKEKEARAFTSTRTATPPMASG